MFGHNFHAKGGLEEFVENFIKNDDSSMDWYQMFGGHDSYTEDGLEEFVVNFILKKETQLVLPRDFCYNFYIEDGVTELWRRRCLIFLSIGEMMNVSAQSFDCSREVTALSASVHQL